MPYEWIPSDFGKQIELRAWPHRSLSRRGFAVFIATTSVLIAVPLIGLIGKPVLWGVLPFLVAAVSAIWFALRRSERDREILEELILTRARARLVRTGPKIRHQEWEANSHWVQPILHPKGGPVPQYLTLRGGEREVELGAFLTEEERLSLHAELQSHLSSLRVPLRPDAP
jgi:uncharacterized membrane protein